MKYKDISIVFVTAREATTGSATATTTALQQTDNSNRLTKCKSVTRYTIAFYTIELLKPLEID